MKSDEYSTTCSITGLIVLAFAIFESSVALTGAGVAIVFLMLLYQIIPTKKKQKQDKSIEGGMK